MKIRIKGNSIRYRLTMPEVEALSKGESIEETTAIGADTFRYALKPDRSISVLKATLDRNTIILWVPENDALGWADSARVGFSNTIPMDGGEVLSLLLEKDFACLDETGEDQSDNFPNPRGHT